MKNDGRVRSRRRQKRDSLEAHVKYAEQKKDSSGERVEILFAQSTAAERGFSLN
jgi:hypothetical protein